MKKFIIFLLCFSSGICFGQADSTVGKRIVLGVNAGAVLGSEGFGACSNFTMEKGHSHFEVGPVFGPKKDLRYVHSDYYYRGNVSLTGLNAVYQISLNPKRKIFQSYFQNEFFFHYYIDNNTTQEVYTNQGHQFLLAPISYKSHQTIIGDYIGLGFKVKFLNNFYVNQSIGMGMEYYSKVLDYEDINYSRSDHSFQPGVILKLGLGYKFDYKFKPSPAGPIKKKNAIISYSAFSAEQLDSIISNSTISTGKIDSLASPKIVFGFNIGIMPSYQWEGLDYYALLTLEKGKNIFSGGPVIGQKAEINNHENHSITGVYGLTGFNFVYQRNPNPNHKKFGIDLFFQHEFILRHYNDQGTSYVNDHNTSVFQSYESRQTDIQGYLGYGCKEKLFKNFYLNQSIGIGIIYRSTVINYEDIKYNSNEHGTELGLLLKMGIGYKFDYKNKAYSAIPVVQRDSIKQTDFFATEKNILRFGINIGAMPSYQWQGLDYYAHFTIEKGRSFVAGGPVIGLKLKMENNYSERVSEQYGLTGFYVVYQRFTKPRGKRFDFYFQNEFMFHHYTDKGIYITGVAPNPLIVWSYKSEQKDIQDHIGYGVKVKFLKNFYVDQSFGIGIKYNTTVIDYGDPAFNKGDKHIQSSATIKMAFGYTFGGKLK
jgi:hypothetical protein